MKRENPELTIIFYKSNTLFDEEGHHMVKALDRVIQALVEIIRYAVFVAGDGSGQHAVSRFHLILVLCSGFFLLRKNCSIQ